MLMDLYKFEINRHKKTNFRNFLWIQKTYKNIITRYKDNGIIKSYTFYKVYYIKFKFKKGSMFCCLRSLARLIKKERINKKYFQAFINMLNRFKKEVYKFYCKELPDGGIINKWI
ncbi:DUF226 domain-containing protein [Borreliella garinii]|uniref:DUF226 domain-containing protein n=1 Tax=Borreliella garinii TaxID=29519 RepID=UPI001F42B756|nr:DUF226 domain-containing protein [Borreliella garinii]